MTDQEIAKALEKMKQGDAKRPPEERLHDLYEAGIIDACGRVFSESLREVDDLLKKKGFTSVSTFHIGGVPGGNVKLHEKVADGRDAIGSYDEIRKIIKSARSHEGLWKALDVAGYSVKAPKPGKKRTG